MVRSTINLSTGRMEFVGDEAIKQSYSDASALFWNNTTKRIEEDAVYYNYNKTLHSLGIGGAAANDTRFHVKGTTANHIARLDTGLDFNLVAPPSTPPTLTLLGIAGNVNVGRHFYRFTYKTSIGETELNTGTGATTTYIDTVAGNQQVLVSNIPVPTDYRVSHVCIYRAVTGGTYWLDVKKVGEVVVGTTTFIDNLADASRIGLDSFARANTTNRLITVNSSPAAFISPQSTSFGYRANEGFILGTTPGGENALFGALVGVSTYGTKNAAFGTFINVGYSDSSVFAGHNAGGIGVNFQGCIVVGRNAAFWNTQSYSSIYLGGGKGIAYYQASYVTSVGMDALGNIATGAGNLVVLGTKAANNLTTAVGCGIFGAFVDAPFPGVNGQLNAFNILYGLGGYASSVSSSMPTAAAQIGIGIVPTANVARLEVVAGSSVYVPFKLNEGNVRSIAISGGVEYNGTSLFFTNNSSVRQNIMMSAYGQLYEDNETGSSLTTFVPTVFYGWVSATANGVELMTADTANATADRLTVNTGGDGVYLVEFSVSYATTNNNVTAHWQVFKNGVAVANCNTERKFINGNYLSAVSSHGIITLNANDYIDLRVSTDNAGEILTIKHCSLVAVRIKR